MANNTWDWEVQGAEVPPSPGSTGRALDQRGTYACELMGEVVQMLVERGEFWELLDEEHPLTITITPAGGVEF